MDYCVISGHSFRCKKISVSREKIWSKNTGRTTDGTMTGDIVAIKKKYVIEMPPMSGAEVALLDGLLSEPFFTAKLKNPQTNTIVEDTFYSNSPTYPVYSYANGLPEYVGVQFNLIEQ